jgi:ubiquinone/menaquinone biosynthesis C-methylase UbiE
MPLHNGIIPIFNILKRRHEKSSPLIATMSQEPVRRWHPSPDNLLLKVPDLSLIVNSSDEWGRFAKAFNKLLETGVSTSTAKDMTKAANAAYPYTSASTILDIGCGPGEVIAEVLRSHGTELPDSSRIVASDFSAGMIEQLIHRKNEAIANGEATWGKVETLQCDATDLSAVQDNSVSHALAGFVLFMVPNVDIAMKEIRRVLTDQKGGGVLALSSWEANEWIDLISSLSKVRPDKHVPKMPAEWGTIEGIRGQLDAAGFRDIDVHPSETFWPFDNYEETVHYLLTQLPILRKLTADVTRGELEEVHKLMVEVLKARHPSLPSRMRGTAIVGLGRK